MNFLYLIVILGLLERFSSAADQCALFQDTLFEYNTFTAATLVNKTGTTTAVDGVLRLTINETFGGTIGYVWHNSAERIADGFVSTFKFKIQQKTDAGDGFTYFIQNDKTVDLNGGTGDKLGAFGIKSAIAVRFDLCPDRPAPCGSGQHISLSLVANNLSEIDLGTSTFNASIVDGIEHTVVVRYDGRAFGDDAKLSVQLDTQTIFNNIVIGDLSREELFNGRFAFFGFTASTSWTETSQIDITSWKTVLVPSDTAVKEFSTEAIARFEFGTVANFTILKRDSCTNIIPFGSNATILAKLSQQVPSDADAEDFPKLDGNITDNGDGTLTASFQLPESVQGLWDLDIQANGVRSEGMPWIGGVESFKPAPQGSGLPIWALILLLLLILLIILVLSYVVYRLHRYRKKLQKNAEFIEAGKKQAELDRLEDGTSYVANPMVGTIDDLKTQLGKNEEELERLRKRGALGEDQNFTIEQLQKQRDALLEEMNRLKREEQEEELKKSKGTSDFVAGGRAKKEFGREQI